MGKAIPDRWLNYSPTGKRIMGTRFVAFKVPLREKVISSVQDDLRLSCESLVERIPNLGLIIDLTNTNRYYDPDFFIQRGIQHQKLMIPGHDIPTKNRSLMFTVMVKDFLETNVHNSKLIGVHCTHGVNRTGYLICRFMASVMKIQPEEAIKRFEAARGHPIERANYLHDLIRGSALESTKTVEPSSNWRNNRNIQTESNTVNSSTSEHTYDNWRQNRTSSNMRSNGNFQTESNTVNSSTSEPTYGEYLRNRPSSNWRQNRNVQTESSTVNSSTSEQTYGDYLRNRHSNLSNGQNSQIHGRWRTSKDNSRNIKSHSKPMYSKQSKM